MADDHRDRDNARCVLNSNTPLCPTDSREIATIEMFEPYCSEFLIHAADNEGLQAGIDTELVTRLSEWCTIPVTYAGGARTVEDLDLVQRSSNGKVDLTIGSALDVFGGSGAKFDDCVQWNTSASRAR
jgi:phosphoribosylformimino-5-aminoimidazole carboxamide ribotide isomerase